MGEGFASSSVAGLVTPARTASSCAADARPKNTASDVRKAHSRRPMIPAKGPYVSPKASDAVRYRDRRPVKANHRTTVTIAPAASHDIEGWRRRGTTLNNREKPASTNTNTTGQRTISQMVTAVSLHPVAAPASSIAEPAMNMTNATRMRTPTETASTKAVTYFLRALRSLSTP